MDGDINGEMESGWTMNGEMDVGLWKYKWRVDKKMNEEIYGEMMERSMESEWKDGCRMMERWMEDG